MELKVFIEQTIIQITDGLLAGHNYIESKKFGEGVSDDKGKEINFDIAVSSNEEEKSGLGGKISVAQIFSLGGENQVSATSSNVSRIQFRIFIHVKTKKEPPND